MLVGNSRPQIHTAGEIVGFQIRNRTPGVHGGARKNPTIISDRGVLLKDSGNNLLSPLAALSSAPRA